MPLGLLGMGQPPNAIAVLAFLAGDPLEFVIGFERISAVLHKRQQPCEHRLIDPAIGLARAYLGQQFALHKGPAARPRHNMLG